ncbi:MAG: YbhB/YbcL family Raf kinase inhibitor-like protein [Sulfurovaceae bacterium]|nr:YbhB/YbcL family Raf kinase inhibitor-like protein [Sulfurovaceae bacterium]
MPYLLSMLFALGIAHAGNLTLMSDDVGSQLSLKQVLDRFGCNGENISPALVWTNAPAGTKSFAITMYDPDASNGWWHWIVYDISPTETSISRDASALGTLPKGSIEGVTSFGASGFGGACPPKGDSDHGYVFTVYALDVDKLGLSKDTDPASVQHNIDVHTIQKSSITSYYGRK